MHYFNGELIPEEKWMWVAAFVDGSVLKQFDDDGNFHQMKEIDVDNLSIWSITDGERSIAIDMTDGKKPIHFYRRSVSHTIGSDDKTVSTTYGFGYSFGDNKFVYMISEDDIVLTDGNDNIIESGRTE